MKVIRVRLLEDEDDAILSFTKPVPAGFRVCLIRYGNRSRLEAVPGEALKDKSYLADLARRVMESSSPVSLTIGKKTERL